MFLLDVDVSVSALQFLLHTRFEASKLRLSGSATSVVTEPGLGFGVSDFGLYDFGLQRVKGV